MTAGNCLTNPKISFRGVVFVTLLMVAGPITPSRAEPFEGPSFRQGMWHFVRTIDLVLHKKTGQRLLQRETTRCVDPTHAMMATFASPSVGNCVSAKPEKVKNRYTFANRCDFTGPVSTVITVHSEEAYTELNASSAGFPKTELVVAHRIGDCQDGR
ncbi:hypothetical protein [Bradyrhizobium sp.]|uniref:hypothetical protein n=1 Tax=Bradyrhizobium sp. TaxID=376 RepID=UPI000A639808|nr:hypothetical protein [Bradyrhizobium sp.]